MGACKYRKKIRLYELLGLSISFVLSLSCTSQQQFAIMPSQEVVETNLTYNNEVDVLFVVDTSRTMSAHQVDLSEQTSYFLDALIDTKLDFNIAVTTMDMRHSAEQGEFVGSPRVLTAHTPNLYQVLEQRIAIMGEGGSSVEQGLASMRTAVEREAALFQSEFFRPDSLLVLVFLTNEDDVSPEADYIGLLDSLKPPLPSGERSWVSHFIGVLPGASDCASFEGQYVPGYKYLDLSIASGGVMENICNADLRVAVGSIRSRVVQFITDIRLDRVPDLSTVRVKVNGVQVPQSEVNGWSYVSEYNLIRFHGSAVPKADAVVQVDFDPIGIKSGF